jgi:hypothetical protein
VSISWCCQLLSNPTANFYYNQLLQLCSRRVIRCRVARGTPYYYHYCGIYPPEQLVFTPLFIATGPCFEAASSSSGPHHKRNEKLLGIPHPARRHIGTNPTYMHILHRIYVYGIQIHLFSVFFSVMFCGITFCVRWCDG